MAVTFLTNEDKVELLNKIDSNNNNINVDDTLTQEGQAADAKATGEAIGKISEDVVDLSDGTVTIPDYWVDAVNVVEAQLADLQSKGGVDAVTFGFITDTHSGSKSNGNFAKLMERVMKTCNIPLMLHGGDFISGVGVSSKAEHLAEIKQHNFIFRNLESKMLATMGNHEAVYGVDANYDSTLTTGEIYNYIFRKNAEKDGLVFGDTGTYFYRDIPAQKTRYIILDCYDFKSTTDESQKILEWSKLSNAKIGSTQLTWLADTALKVPDGYSIVICSHVAPLLTAELPTGWSEHTGCLADAEVLRGVIDAYINKATYVYSGDVWYGCVKDIYSFDLDFTDYHGEIVCWCSGHTHMDKIFDLNGLHVIVTANCSSHIQSIDAPNKTPGTDTEYIMDFVCVNKRTRACNVIRLGAALADDVTCTINTYTNWVTKGGEGWTEGYRLNSVGEVVEGSGYAISNFVPVCNGDMLLFKGWTKTPNFIVVQFYNVLKEPISTRQWTGDNTEWWFEVDYDTSVQGIDTKLAFAAGATNCRYARISGQVDAAAELIATVNEDIRSIEQPGRGFNY
jgi:hypothetical protein